MTNLTGRTFVVISQTDFRLILEEDESGMRSGKVIVVDAESIEGVDHGTLKIAETK